MPSDVEVRSPEPEESSPSLMISAVLERLAPALDPFRSAVAEAAEEVRLYRARHEEIAADPAGRMARELGPFAEGRIDPLRLVGLLADRIMSVAHERFAAASSGGSGSYRLSVPEGGDLRDAVKDALAEVGRAFGTARAVEKARQRRYQPDQDHVLLHPHPFHRWSPAERSLSPPLVVEVDGAGLRGAGLLEFIEGGQKFVLFVRGGAPPAPLARLATPGVFVAQVEGDSSLEAATRLAAHDGPGAVAVFEEGSGVLVFRHEADGAVEVDEEGLRSAIETAEGAPGKPGLLDLRYLEGLMAAARSAAKMAEMVAAPASDSGAGAVGAAAGGPISAAATELSGGAPAGDTAPSQVAGVHVPSPAGSTPTVDQLAEWLLDRTDPATG